MEKKKLLVIRFSSLGDIVLTTGPLQALKVFHPDTEIHFLTSELGGDLLTGVSEIHKIHCLPDSASLWQTIQFFRTLPKMDAVADLHDSLRSRLFCLLSSANSAVVKKNSRARRAFVQDKKHRPELAQHVVQKYFETLAELFPMTETKIETLRPFLAPTRLTTRHNDFDFASAIALHPYASQENKRWPYFVELAEQLLKSGESVFVLGADDATLNWPESDRFKNLTNKTSLREMTSLLRAAKALVTTDSGPMHIGIATETPTLALFGPTTKEFGFYPVFSQTQVIENTKLDCRPCHVHGGESCPLGHHQCMKDISVEQVIEGLKSLS